MSDFDDFDRQIAAAHIENQVSWRDHNLRQYRIQRRGFWINGGLVPIYVGLGAWFVTNGLSKHDYWSWLWLIEYGGFAVFFTWLALQARRRAVNRMAEVEKTQAKINDMAEKFREKYPEDE
jgi:hypothetical protein